MAKKKRDVITHGIVARFAMRVHSLIPREGSVLYTIRLNYEGGSITIRVKEGVSPFTVFDEAVAAVEKIVGNYKDPRFDADIEDD